MAPLIAAALISGGIGLAGSGVNSWLQSEENDKQRKAAIDAYNKQRADAMADWERNNSYNSPIQQMNRLRQAGLNPNLVYGTGAANTAQMARSSQATPPSTIAPKIDTTPVSNALNQYYNAKQIETNISNTQENTRLAVKQGLLTDAKTASEIQGKATSEFQLEQSKKLQDQTIEAANLTNQEKRVNIANITQQTAFGVERNDRERIASSRDLAKTMQEIIQSKETTKNIKLNGEQERELRQLDINLRKTGVMPHDPIYIRAVAKWYNTFKEGWKDQLSGNPKHKLWEGISW